jgi:DNA primase
MAGGRIVAQDVTYVIDHSNIAEVIGDYVQLKNAGGGQRKGLCPFHDEKTPSFHVTPAKGFYHCFGCQEGGNVITFLTKLEHLTFVEAVEKLAARLNYQLHYEQGRSESNTGINRSRLVEANVAAMQFYQAELEKPGPASNARALLQGRGFDRQAALDFQVGYAPDAWDEMRKALLQHGFTDEELLAAGLTKEGSKGPIDRFRNRVIWPVKDASGDVVGFGARKLSSDSEDSGPKYLNTPETAIYKKSQILFGLDKAKKEIAKARQVVIVEGYTDVMAAHLAGVKTAVATCGTAFGDGHINIIRRYLLDDDTFGGEIIFTFDGDAAGQKAALKAFSDDQKFVAQTFVAVARNGMDPCELRQAEGDDAVRALVNSRIPLFEFALKEEIKEFNLSTPEGRVAALNKVAPLVGKIKDKSLRPEYIRQLALWIGIDPESVQKKVNDSYRSKNTASAFSASNDLPKENSFTVRPTDPLSQAGRELLKLALQHPELVNDWPALNPHAFPFPPYQAIRAVLDQIEFSKKMAIEEIIAKFDEAGQKLVRELLVEPITSDESALENYSYSIFARVQELALTAEIAELKSELSRVNPESENTRYNEIFAQLMELEKQRRLALGQIMGQ